MADKKITDLQLISSITDALNIPCDNGIASYKATALQLFNYLKTKGLINDYDSTITYSQDQIVIYSGKIYISLENSNQGNTPSSNPSKWSIQGYYDLSQVYSNALLNGAMNLFQRGTSINAASRHNNDDADYIADRWQLFSDGNDVVDISRDTDAPTGFKNSMKFDVQTINKQFGIAQKIESFRSIPFSGKAGSISFYAKTNASNTINNLRVALLSWDGTEDTITTDIISAWNGSGSNPTFVANLTLENSPIDLGLTDSWQRFELVNLDIDTSGMKNLILFIWVDDDDAALNDLLYITGIQLNEGSVARDFEHKSIDVELSECERYFEKSYDVDTTPGTATSNGCVTMGIITDTASYFSGVNISFKKTKRTVPTVKTYDLNGTIDKRTKINTGSWAQSHNVSRGVYYVGHKSWHGRIGAGNSDVGVCQFTADAEL